MLQGGREEKDGVHKTKNQAYISCFERTVIAVGKNN